MFAVGEFLVLCLEIEGAVPLDLRTVDEELHLISAFVVGFPFSGCGENHVLRLLSLKTHSLLKDVMWSIAFCRVCSVSFLEFALIPLLPVNQLARSSAYRPLFTG